MSKISEFINQLADLKITANKWLDDNCPNEKREWIENKKETLNALISAADVFEEPFDTEGDLVRNICEYCSDTKKSPEETILEIGLFALAWDEIY
jgi:hypothetical protein